MTKPVTAEMVKELRARTGVGMAKCKEALDQSGGDMDLAIANLRKAGIASAVKKEGRETKEGLIGVAESAKALALIEVNAETDFVAKNESFQKFLSELALEVANTTPVSVDAFLQQKFSKDHSLTIDQHRAIVVQSIGENLKVQRIAVFQKGNDRSLGFYSHMGGKIVTFVEIEGASGEEALAKDIAMHIAAEAPQYLDSSEIPADVKAHEEDIAKGQVKGKPENIIAKIVEGKINAFYDQVCLLRQKFVKDHTITIEQLVAAKAKEIGKPIKLKRFLRWQVGEQSVAT
ncbi:MAG: translation elongation factor Ts [Chlamydiales bacterium]|nr:translation elongation factor Ts [Chlamydiales bacterium]